MRSYKVRKIAAVGLLTAIVILFQLLGSFIRFGAFSVSLVLLPIVIGASLYGAGAGAWLGFVFGLTVLLSGDAGVFLAVNIPGTVLTVLLKGTLAGAIAGRIAFSANSKGRTLRLYLAALACPVVNTGIFLLGCPLFFWGQILEWAGSTNATIYLFTGFVGLNFLFELLTDILLAPILVRIVRAVIKE